MSNKLPSGWKATTWQHATPMGEDWRGVEGRAGVISGGRMVLPFTQDETDDITWVRRAADDIEARAGHIAQLYANMPSEDEDNGE